MQGNTKKRLKFRRSVKKSFKKRFLKHTIRRALLLLDNGNYPSQVARILHVSPQCLHYHIKKWVKLGWIKLDKRTPNITLYKVSPSIKKTLTGGKDFTYKGVRQHALSLKFPIVRGPGRRVDWRRVKVAGGHWTRFIGSECGLTVEKTTKHVIVHADEICLDNPNEAFLLGVVQCLRLAEFLEQKFDMQLGDPSLLRNPHWGVYSPVAAEIAKLMQFSDDVGSIDESEGYGEIDYYYPQLAKEFLLVPVYVRALLRFQREFAKGMADHRAMIKSIQARTDEDRAMIQEIRELVEQLRRQNRRVKNNVFGT